MKFLIIAMAAVMGNGIGAWNIRTISSGRLWMTAGLTFVAATINMTIVREIAREVNGMYVVAYALGSVVGIVTTTWLDKRYFTKKEME